MTLRNSKWLAILSIAITTQVGCYNTYTINKSELAKLESSVERVEVVEVLADCPEDSIAYRSLQANTLVVAQAEGETDVATDAAPAESTGAAIDGCTRVPVSTVNALTVLTGDGGRERVTPFNFVMDDTQLVSPEYDLLLQMSDIDGAEVREFSRWKTVTTIAGVGLLSVGAFFGVALLAPDEQGFN